MTGGGAEVIQIDEGSLPAARAFLERNPETSLFLLSNIRAFGTRLGVSLYSGNLKALMRRGEIQGVFCLTRGGSLLAQTDGRPEFAERILEACRDEPIAIGGVLGEWNITSAIWALLRGRGVTPTIESKEVLYRLDLRAAGKAHVPPAGTGIVVRMLEAADYEAWSRRMEEFLAESKLPLQGTDEQRRAAFVRSTGLRHWWGAFDGDELVAIVGITALHESIAQIGGVFTRADRRRAGLSRAVTSRVVQDARDIHHLDRLFLFTGERNIARRMYESLGFEHFGYFGLFFGTLPVNARRNV